MEFDASSILQNQATSIVLLDESLCITYLNESGQALFNASLKQSLGIRIDQLLVESDQIEIACRNVLVNDGNVRLRDYPLRLASLPAAIHVNCIVSHALLDGVSQVMLELIEVEAAGKIGRDEEFVQRQQANQAVIRGLAHEIRNPLGGIRGAAQLMSEEAGSEQFDEYTKIIIREADRLTALVNRMQAETRVDLDQSVNIHRLLEHVRQLLLADGKPVFSVLADYDPSLPRVRGNSDLLIQALLNVLRNAGDAVSDLGDSGQIRLRTRIDHLAIGGRRQQVVRIDVIDNGPGVAREIEHQIFDPMVTGKTNGTGLGLPISAEIVNQHHGALDFISVEGQTTFRFYLPIVGRVEESASVPGQPMHEEITPKNESVVGVPL